MNFARTLKHISVAIATVGALAACSKETTVIQYMPHMSNTTVLKAQRGYDGFGNGASVVMPPEHTIARGHKPYRIETVEQAEAQLKNPLPMNMANLQRGRKVYNNYCMVCHGERGYGDGPVVNPFPIPKSLQSENMLKWNDGHIFHVITKGQGVMPSYAQQIQPEDRWAAILYVRALQRAEHPSQDDLRELKKHAANNGMEH